MGAGGVWEAGEKGREARSSTWLFLNRKKKAKRVRKAGCLSPITPSPPPTPHLSVERLSKEWKLFLTWLVFAALSSIARLTDARCLVTNRFADSTVQTITRRTDSCKEEKEKSGREKAKSAFNMRN